MGSDDTNEPQAKRRKTGRRKQACNTCSARKVRCDNDRPICTQCKATSNECVYAYEVDESLTLDQAVQILSSQISGLTDRFNGYLAHGPPQHITPTVNRDQLRSMSTHNGRLSSIATSDATSMGDFQEPSRDFAHIPPHKTTADEILTWPIFDNVFSKNYLIDYHLGNNLASDEQYSSQDEVKSDEIVPVSHNVAPLDDHRIPFLVDKFLENVHTKNPILDVECLVRKSREHATKGLAWDGDSCLLLLTCALGLIAKPFGSESSALDYSLPIEEARELAAPMRDRAQADNCFVQASRRLGGLHPSILCAQCHFFAGVYLMYTLRPMLSWQYFHQSSTVYQVYLKMHGRILDDGSLLSIQFLPASSRDPKTARLEQRLFWSTYKSESEFRIELPLPQSEIADYDFPHLFPSPPSPIAADHRSKQSYLQPPTSEAPSLSSGMSQVFGESQPDEISSHAKRLCSEEESWYYYLTEIALRRIGNRVINTFFRQHKSQWLNIERLIDVAIEFETQVSTWQTNLPPAMQKYEIASTIRAPRVTSPGGAAASSVSQELSWATENRLLEMRHWLYQPFLYYLVHARPAMTSPSTYRSDSYLDPILAPETAHGSLQDVFWPLIARAIDCNMTILETRTIPHRHHGLWFDLRAITCASLILLAVVKSGYLHLIPGGAEALVGTSEERDVIVPSEVTMPIRGKFGRVLRQLEIWSAESPDMIRARETLKSLIIQILPS